MAAGGWTPCPPVIVHKGPDPDQSPLYFDLASNPSGFVVRSLPGEGGIPEVPGHEAEDVVYVPRYIDRPIVVAPRIPVQRRIGPRSLLRRVKFVTPFFGVIPRFFLA